VNSEDEDEHPFGPEQMLRVFRSELEQLTAALSFAWTDSSLKNFSLVREFEASFESAAFGCFDVAGLSIDLQLQLRGLGDGAPPVVADPFPSKLLSSTAMRQHLPDLATDNPHPGFEVVGPLLLEGSLAMALRNGGPYSGMEAARALHLATEFRSELIGTRFEDLFVVAGCNWSPWFYDVAWDHGWIMTDFGTAQAYLLCASGND